MSTWERERANTRVDHARNMATLAELTGNESGKHEDVHTLALDFADALTSIALHPSERRCACAELRGHCYVVWKVLGFGGMPDVEIHLDLMTGVTLPAASGPHVAMRTRCFFQWESEKWCFNVFEVLAY